MEGEYTVIIHTDVRPYRVTGSRRSLVEREAATYAKQLRDNEFWPHAIGVLRTVTPSGRQIDWRLNDQTGE